MILFLERYKIRHFCLYRAEDGGFIVCIRKNAPKTAETSDKRAKMWQFSHIKQNSIAEIVSTMESFLVAEVGFERPTRKYSRRRIVRSGASRPLLIFSLVALALSRTASARAPSPLPPRRFATAEVVKGAKHTVAKEKADAMHLLFYFVCVGLNLVFRICVWDKKYLLDNPFLLHYNISFILSQFSLNLSALYVEETIK